MAAENEIPDVPSSPPHRTATVSAAAALENGDTRTRPLPVSTGLGGLDGLLKDSYAVSRKAGGLARGQLTEVYGPPGSGKTALAIEASARALCEGSSAIWLDTAGKVSGPRLTRVFENHCKSRETEPEFLPAPAQSYDELLEQFHHFSVPTLPHLLALLSPSSASFPPPGTSLVIVDSISSILDVAYPSHQDARGNQTVPKETLKWARSRKWDVISDVLSRLAYLAATYDVAVLLLSQTIIERDEEQEKLLRPIFDFKAWNENIKIRIVLFRDFMPSEGGEDGENPPTIAHVAALVKLYYGAYASIGDRVWFEINESGLRQLSRPSPQVEATVIQGKPRRVQTVPPKRPLESEVADSQSEDDPLELEHDIDWIEEDAALEQRDHEVPPEDDADHAEEAVRDDEEASGSYVAVEDNEPLKGDEHQDEDRARANGKMQGQETTEREDIGGTAPKGETQGDVV